MVRVVLRALGLLTAAVASVETYFAIWFRLDSASELKLIEQVDLELGAMWDLALLLLAPSGLQGPRCWLCTAGGAVLLSVVVSGSLIWWHREQYRIRSTLPARLDGCVFHNRAQSNNWSDLEPRRSRCRSA